MKRIFTLVLMFIALGSSYGQVTVTGSIGANGTYASLTNAGGAFQAINAVGQSSANITITITSDVLTESGINALNAGAWTSLNIYPSGSRTISGTVDGAALIKLNGADYVRIDGLNAGGNALTIANLSTSSLATTATLCFINDACVNTVTNCTLLGAASMPVVNAGGTILFSTGSVSGNDNNSITNNNIGNASSGFPSVAISSYGMSGTIVNNDNSISSNNIYNWYSTTDANAINIIAFSSAYTINNNRFYQTAARMGMGAANFLKAIYINTLSGTGYSISNNIIGYGNSLGTGMFTSSGGSFTGIDMAVDGVAPVSTINGNVINNINWAGNSGSCSLSGIMVVNGWVNIGNVSGNIIGATSGMGSSTNGIYFSSTVTGSGINGVVHNSMVNCTIQNNKIGAITTGGVAGIGYYFYGIITSGAGSPTIISNSIGNSSPHSICIGSDLSTTANCVFYGIRNMATGNVQIGGAGTANFLRNVDLRTSGTSTFNGLYNSSTPSSLNVSYYSISNIAMGWTTTPTTGDFVGLYSTSSITGSLSFASDTIRDISLNTSGTISLLLNNNTTSTYSILNNVFMNISRSPGINGNFYGLNLLGAPVSGGSTINANRFVNLSAGTGVNRFYGIYSNTSSTQAISLSNNSFNNMNGGSDGAYAIYAAQGNSLSINRDTINGVFASGSVYGIVTGGTGVASDIFLNQISGLVSSSADAIAVYSGTPNSSVYKNKMYDIQSTGITPSVCGVHVNAGTTVNIYNNLIGNLNAPIANTSNAIKGINVAAGTTVNLYYNTVNVNASSSGALFGSSAISAATGTTLDMRNNIFVNTSTPNGINGYSCAYRRSSTTLTSYAATSNNNLFYAGTPGPNRLVMYDGTTGYTTINNYKILVSPRDAAAVTELPTWSNTLGSNSNYLHINTTIPTLIESGGGNIASYTNDFDNDVRNATKPDIGADEFSGIAFPACSGTPSAAAISGVAGVCYNSGTTLEINPAYTDLGLTYQWAYSNATGGPYTNLLGTYSTQNTGNLVAPRYYVCTVSCSNSGLSFVTPEKAININALPVVAINPATTKYCIPGGSPVMLTASGAVTYSWNPATELSLSSDNPIFATPITTTTYTVTGTDANACVNTASAVVTISEAPVMTSVTASPAFVCANGTSQLLAHAVTTTSYTVAVNNLSPVNTLGLTAGTYITPPNGDDVVTNSLPIGFVFNFYGKSYSTFQISTNGNIQFGDSASNAFSVNAIPSTNAPNNYIALAFKDWLNVITGMIKYYTTGTAPNRILIVDFNDPGYFVGQIILHESTNMIDIISTNIPSHIGVQGIENKGGTAGLVVPGRNAVSWSSPTTSSYTFSPAGTDANYLWDPSVVLNATGIANPLATNLTTTTVFPVTASVGGCSVSGSVTVGVDVPLSVGADANPISLCAGNSTSLSALVTGGGGPYTYSWKVGGIEVSSTQNYTVTPSSSTVYVLTVSDNCAQSASTSVNVTVYPVPSATAGSITPVCSGSSLQLSGSTDVGTSYSWTGPNGFLSSVQNPTIFPAMVAATGTYSFTATSNGCSSVVSTTTVVVNPSPIVTTTSASDTLVCYGTSINLNSTASSNVYNTLNYTESFETWPPSGWTFINAGTGNQWATISSYYHDGAKSMSYTYNSSNAANAWGITPALNMDAGTTYTLSFWYKVMSASYPERLKITVGLTPNVAGQTTILWDNNGAASLTNTTWLQATVTYTPTTTAVYYVGFNCYSLLDKEVLYVDQVSITGATLTPVSYLWTATPAGFVSSLQNPTGVSPSATTTYTMTASNTYGCSASANTMVAVNKPLPVITGSSSACAGTTGVVYKTNPGNSNYTWTVSGGGTITSGGTLTDSSATVSWDTPGAQSISVNYTNTLGCTAALPTTYNVTANSLPTVGVTGSNMVCEGLTEMYTTDLSMTNYDWHVSSGGTIIAGGSASDPSVTVTWDNPGPQSVSANYEDANGCNAMSPSTFGVLVKAAPIPSLIGIDDVCKNASGVVYSTDASMSNYDWNVSSGGTITSGGGSTDNTVTITWNTTGPQTLTIDYRNGNNCYALTPSELIVNVNALPVPTITGLSSVCANASALIYTTESGMTDYVWNTSAGLDIVAGGSATDNTVTIDPLSVGNEDIEISYTDANGCEAASSVHYPVTVGGAPIVALGHDTILCADQSITLNAGNAGATYLWSLGAATTQSVTIDSLGHGTTTFPVCVSVDNGCSVSDTILITFDPCTGLNENNSLNVSVYPNPNHGVLYINIGDMSDVHIKLNSIDGKCLFSGKASELKGSSDVKELDISSYASGVYFMHLSAGNLSRVMKIVKQ